MISNYQFINVWKEKKNNDFCQKAVKIFRNREQEKL